MNESEQKTADLMNLNYDALADEIQNRYSMVQLAGSDKRIYITKLQAWSKEQVGGRFSQMKAMYSQMGGFNPGDWCTYLVPIRRMRQSLIVANDDGKPGACLRVERASRFDPSKNDYVPMPNEGDIANFFELANNERAELKFLDDSNILYLVRTGFIMERPEPKKITTTGNANDQLAKLLDL